MTAGWPAARRSQRCHSARRNWSAVRITSFCPLLSGSRVRVHIARAARWIDPIRRLARAASVAPLEGDLPKGAAQAVLDEATIILPLAGLIDLDAERARLKKDADKAAGEAEKLERKLGNADFVAKAKEGHVVVAKSGIQAWRVYASGETAPWT